MRNNPNRKTNPKILTGNFTPRLPPQVVVGNTEQQTTPGQLKAPAPFAERLKNVKSN